MKFTTFTNRSIFYNGQQKPLHTECHQKQQNMHQTKRREMLGISSLWKILGFIGHGESVGIRPWEFYGNSHCPTGFSVSMRWVWKLKSNSHGSPEILVSGNTSQMPESWSPLQQCYRAACDVIPNKT